MANLAIKGHPTRGKEVIEILEMLGGKISHECGYEDGFDSDFMYFIDTNENSFIDGVLFGDENPTKFSIFTIEEFLEKYPYKIGDKVEYIKYDDEEFSVYEIMGMMWTGYTIVYTLDSFGFTCLKKDIRLYKEKNMNKNFKSLNVETYLKVWDETENGLEVCVAEGYEMIEKNGQFYIVKQKTKYPRDFDECCEVLDYHLKGATIIGYKKSLLENFQKLLICRDAYWKIYGEEMGLGKPWEPDWNTNELKYIIYYENDRLWFNDEISRNTILAFPTEEMRDAFYENFKGLIESCNKLL